MRLSLVSISSLVLCGAAVVVLANHQAPKTAVTTPGSGPAPQPNPADPLTPKNPPPPVVGPGAGPIQPEPIPLPLGPNQPIPHVMMLPGNTNTISHLEEEVELLEAQRETKKAMVKAAEVAVKFAELNLGWMEKKATTGAASAEGAEKARNDVEAAKVQVEIRLAEMKEVEVKIKYAKKRLESAKAGPPGLKPVTPVPIAPPKAIEPKLIPEPPPPKPNARNAGALKDIIRDQETAVAEVRAEVDKFQRLMETSRLMLELEQRRADEKVGMEGALQKAEIELKKTIEQLVQVKVRLKEEEVKLQVLITKLKEMEK